MTLDLYDVSIQRDGREVRMVREVHDHGSGACVLPYDEARRTALLVRQLRVPVHVTDGDGLILEAAAGIADAADTDPAETARREAAEELQYAVHDLREVATFYPIPGMVTERMSCFIARYTPEDRLSDGPAADDDEVLEVEEWGLDALWDALEAGQLRDGKALVCLQGLRIARPDLFS